MDRLLGPGCIKAKNKNLLPALKQKPGIHPFNRAEPAVASVSLKSGQRELWVLGGFDPINSTAIYKTSVRSHFGWALEFVPGPDLPIEMTYHCAVQTSNGIFVHGTNRETFIYDIDHEEWIEIGADSRCGPYFDNDNVQCGLHFEDEVEFVIVPSLELRFDDDEAGLLGTLKACTGVFNVNESKWSKSTRDDRHGIIGGRIVNSSKNRRLFYLGGVNSMLNGTFGRLMPNETNTVPNADFDLMTTKSIYEFKGVKLGWEKWENYELPFGVFDTTLIAIPEDDSELVCDKNVDWIKNVTRYFKLTLFTCNGFFHMCTMCTCSVVLITT